MKQKIILPALAIILLAVFGGPWLLLLFIAIPLGMFVANYMVKRDEAVDPRHTYSTLDEVTTLYGEPDDVVVLDATRANELTALILFYDTRGIAIVDSHEIAINDITGVAPKNLAIPYMPDDYGIVLSTSLPVCSTIQLSVAGEMGFAQEIASQIATHLTTRQG
ncbi:MAG: hypothetical protein IJK21_07490 [Prevotella sp.]|nr:hypothetical protein [Prevotella sp.]